MTAFLMGAGLGVMTFGFVLLAVAALIQYS